MGNTEQATDEFTRLVDQNGLAKLFANRVRARIFATLFYADEPLTAKRIAAGAGVTQTAVHEAIEPLARFEVLEEHDDDGTPAFALVDDDELVEAVRTVAEIATERFYEE